MGEFVLQSPLNATTMLIVPALVIAGWAVMYIASRRALKREVENLRRESEERIESLEAEIRASVQPASTPGPVPSAQANAVGTVAPKIPAPVPPTEKEEVTPETLLLITAAVTTFLGKRVRIRSARFLRPSGEIYNAWAQQGRVFVQASHNLAQRVR